ncbi:unnamed protein product [Brassicogethes aeneus]|uniref:Uncharacterized protein n=1 Tax=Brassicogethes aeneus TaxID=1431903 RepID=A0A9P0B107_BRAAE|nr:unnamed protein product [Brassicogethes aeneus]
MKKYSRNMSKGLTNADNNNGLIASNDYKIVYVFEDLMDNTACEVSDNNHAVNELLNENECNGTFTADCLSTTNFRLETTGQAEEARSSFQQEPQLVLQILSELQQNIIYEKINKFNIFRTDIFNCCVKAM